MYPPIGEALEEAGLWPVEYYITQLQGKIAQYISPRPIYGICAETDRMQGSPATMLRWEQAGIDMEGALETAVEREGGVWRNIIILSK